MPPPTRRHWGSRDALSARVARVLGVNRRSAEALLWGPFSVAERCARVITALREARAHETLRRFLLPIDAAIHGELPPPLTTDFFVEEQLRDGAEDVAQTAYLTAPSLETARAYLRSIDADLSVRSRLRAALAAHWGLT